MKKTIIMFVLILPISLLFSYEEYIVNSIYKVSPDSVGSIVITHSGNVEKEPDEILLRARAEKGRYWISLTTIGDGVFMASPGIYIEVYSYYDFVYSKDAVLVIESELIDKYSDVKLLIAEDGESLEYDMPLFKHFAEYEYDLWKAGKIE